MKHTPEMVRAVVELRGVMSSRNVAARFGISKGAVCGIWDRFNRGIYAKQQAKQPDKIPSIKAGTPRPYVRFQVSGVAYQAFERVAQRQGFDGVNEWLRHLALTASEKDIVAIEAEQSRDLTTQEELDLARVRNLLGQRYSAQAIAAQTKFTYRRVEQLIAEAKASNAPPRVHTPEAAGQEEEGMTPAPLSSSAFIQEEAA